MTPRTRIITVVIPSNPPIKAVLRSLRYDTPIHKLMHSKGLGGVCGGRTGIKSVDVDVSVPEDKFDEALMALEKKLRKLDVPHGTRLISGSWSMTFR